MLDLASVRNRSTSISDIARDLTREDLRALTNEMIDTMQEIIADAVDADVVFVPQDPDANDPFGTPEEDDLAWTLGHVIVHATASSEESAALALTLARGLVVEGRSRYETPWRDVTTIAQVHQRLEESRRMRKSLLDAWPDAPHLHIHYTPYPPTGRANAVPRLIIGLSH